MSYYRQGERSLDNFYKPFHLVEYFRYVRFFPEGKILIDPYWTIQNSIFKMMYVIQLTFIKEDETSMSDGILIENKKSHKIQCLLLYLYMFIFMIKLASSKKYYKWPV